MSEICPLPGACAVEQAPHFFLKTRDFLNLGDLDVLHLRRVEVVEPLNVKYLPQQVV